MKDTKITLPPESNPELSDAYIALIQLAIDLYDPEQILIFGSQATGGWKKDSDIDLLIIEPSISQDVGIMHVESFKKKIRVRFDAIVAKNETLNKFKTDPKSVYAIALKDGFTAYQKK